MLLCPFGAKSTSSLKLRTSRESTSRRDRTSDRRSTSSRTSVDAPLGNNKISNTLTYDDPVDNATLPQGGGIIGEDYGQTLYVEKNNISPMTPLRKAEIVPNNTPSLGLVKASPPKRPSNKQSTMAEIVAIALPALGTLLADPLMSLVDTACVGQVSSIQLAALGPNTAIFNMTFSVLTFISAALANRMARSSLKTPGLSKEERERRREQNECMLSHTLVFATGIGVIVTAGLMWNGPMLVSMLGASAESVVPALQYLYIRALAAPAVLFGSVAQGACLGQQDMWTPMKVMVAAGLVNFLGDMILIKGFGLGTAGAAAATAVSQLAAAVYFFRYLRHGAQKREGIKLKWKGLPTGMSLKPVLGMGRVLLTRSAVLALAYNSMTAVATGMGIHVIAAHQVLLQLFTFAATSTDALSLAAQSLLARDLQDKRRVQSVSSMLIPFAAVAGLTVSALFGSLIAIFPHCFTSDLSVIAIMKQAIPHGVFSLILYSMIVTFEGICVGVGQFEHLPRVVIASTSAALATLGVAQKFNFGLTGIWTSAVIFFSTRFLLHLITLASKWSVMPFKINAPKPNYQVLVATS